MFIDLGIMYSRMYAYKIHRVCCCQRVIDYSIIYWLILIVLNNGISIAKCHFDKPLLFLENFTLINKIKIENILIITEISHSNSLIKKR